MHDSILIMYIVFQGKDKGGLTSLMRKRLTSAARCAIKMRSKEADQKKAVKPLEQDLINGPRRQQSILLGVQNLVSLAGEPK